MTIEDIYKILELVIISKDVWLGSVGGFISYIYDYTKSRRDSEANNTEDKFKFKLSSLFVNIAMGAFVGYCSGIFLENDIRVRDAIIAFSGVFAYNVLYATESKFVINLIEILTKLKK